MTSAFFKLPEHFAPASASSILPELFFLWHKCSLTTCALISCSWRQGLDFFLIHWRPTSISAFHTAGFIPPHTSESKHLSTEWRAAPGRGFLCYLRPVPYVKEQDTMMHRREVTKILYTSTGFMLQQYANRESSSLCLAHLFTWCFDLYFW